MSKIMVIQGRTLAQDDVDLIRRLIRDNPSWHRTKLSKHLCELWDWRAANGQQKDMACRSMLRTLDARGLIALPKPRRRSGLPPRPASDVLHSSEPVVDELRNLQPVRLVEARSDPYLEQLFACFLIRYHYLGYNRPVGENMRYIALDRQECPLAVLLFGSAAWKTKVRDDFIGWSSPTRQQNVNLLTNNTRFLVLPWVTSKCLASHVLAKALRVLSDDWQYRYGHPIYLAESFVDRSRFRGTCYKAANWIRLGTTTGRTRQDTHHRIAVSAKDLYIYALTSNFRDKLCR
jgi:hypothetical protein